METGVLRARWLRNDAVKRAGQGFSAAASRPDRIAAANA